MPGQGWQLRAYRAAARLIPLAAPWVLRRRLARGREDPERWSEKQGKAGAARPDGSLVWMHAVGLGEVMALRGLITAMQDRDPDLTFLVTSGTRTSAEVFGRAMPARCLHQFMPLDAPTYVARFLDHWQPDLSVWAEQDIWPNAVCLAAERDIPLAMVNARMNDAAGDRRARAGGLYRDVLGRFGMVAAQDAVSADNLARFGVQARVSGPLKAAAPVLPCDPAELARTRDLLGGRVPWLAASSHAADEAVALAAGRAGLVIVPRDIGRADEIAAPLWPGAAEGARAHVIDRYGALGLWYRLADAALIGGSFDATQGHNPWEAAALGCAILHGPNVANFASDYEMLHAEGAAVQVTGESLGAALEQDHSEAVARALRLVEQARAALGPLAQDLCAMVR